LEIEKKIKEKLGVDAAAADAPSEVEIEEPPVDF
jgi:recombination protein RecA